MSQVNLADKAAATHVGIESTYGTTPTVYRCFPDEGSITLEQANLPNEDEREHLFKALDPVLGLKSWKAQLGFKLRPSASQLLTGSSPSATLPGCIALKAALGGENYAAGSTVAAGSTASSLNVASGHGSRFKVGQLIAVEVSSALELARVTAISTDALSLWPSLSGSPSTSAIVVNAHAYWPVQEHTSSLTIQHVKALASAGHAWTLNGGAVGAALKIERGAILRYVADVAGSSWTFPEGSPPAYTAASETQAAPHVARDAIVYLQAFATTTRTNYVAEAVTVEITAGTNVLVPELGGVEGVTGVMRTGGRPMAKVTLKQRADTAMMSAYSAQTALSLVLAFPRGSGTSKRFVAIDCPNLVPDGVPQMASENGRWMLTQSYQAECDPNTTTSGLTGANYDHAVKPFGIYLL